MLMKTEEVKNKREYTKRMKEVYDETLESGIGISIERSWELREKIRKAVKNMDDHTTVFKWIGKQKDCNQMEQFFMLFVHTTATMENPLQKMLDTLSKR